MSDPTTPAAAATDASPPTADQVKLALRKVKDPELNLNIIDLGLVYDIMVDGSDVQVDMTLTSPGCPAGPQIMTDVERDDQSRVAAILVSRPHRAPRAGVHGALIGRGQPIQALVGRPRFERYAQPGDARAPLGNSHRAPPVAIGEAR